jgi:hypothetical protein
VQVAAEAGRGHRHDGFSVDVWCYWRRLSVAPAAASQLAAVPATTTPAIRHAARLSPLSAAHPLSLEVALAIRNAPALQARVRGLNDPGSPWYHQFLTPQQTTALYGPTKAQLATVEHYLRANGIRVGYVSPQRNFIDARATVSAAEHAFGVRIWQWRDALTHRVFYASDSNPALPAPVARLVTSITGLDDYVQSPSPLPVPRPAARTGQSRHSAVPRAPRTAVPRAPRTAVPRAAHAAARGGILTTTCTTSRREGRPRASAPNPPGRAIRVTAQRSCSRLTR